MGEPGQQLNVVLVAARNPLNIGAAARAMVNFGFKQLRVVNPYQVAFREARSAVGAARLLSTAQEFSSVADAVADCALVVGTTASQRRELKHPLKALADGAVLIRQELAAQPVALLFGSERTGLSNQDMSHCHWLLRIPTLDEQPSMNMGQAVAVCLYEVARESGSQRSSGAAPATADDLERITCLLVKALDVSGYIFAGADGAVKEKTRRLVRRLKLSAEDAEVWMGMLRQITWKLKH